MNTSYQKSYLAFYSSYQGNITTDPSQMWIPIDDHGFHRGDGVFEAMKWVGKKIWLMKPHLERIEKSCARIGLKMPMTSDQTQKKIEEMVAVSNQSTGIIRVFITRGPGSFGISPYESTAPQIYIVTTTLSEWSPEKVAKGVSLKRASIVPKKGMFAQVKSLNYLPNVLMKKEAIDDGFDFAVGIGENGEVLECSTENLSFLKGNMVVTPPFDSTLRGTSLLRLTELMTNTGLTWHQREFNFEELFRADEVFLVGTTLGVMPVTRIENHLMSQTKRTLELRALLQNDQL